MSCSHPTSIVCVFRAKKIMVLLSSVCVICTTYKHSRAPFSLHLNPPLFHLCLSKLTLLSPCFSLLAFPPSCFILLSICCRIQSARSQFSKPQVWTFPPAPFPLTLSEQHKQTKKKPQNKTKQNKKKPKSTLLGFQSAFHPLIEINRGSTAA